MIDGSPRTPDTASNPAAGRERLIAGYRPLAGVPDELMAPDLRIRAHWLPLLDGFAAHGVEVLRHRFGFADRHMRDTGVVHRIYDDKGGAERPLPLSHVPLLIDQADWDLIEKAGIQRAELLERILADIHGEQRLVQDGRLPAALVAGSPDFLRPMAGVMPAGGAFLQVYAMDLGRSAAGGWCVLRDRTQAPAGIGYTVENRIALSRALPELYRALGIRRLADFFVAFRDHLNSLSAGDGRRIGLLSPGPYNESSFEQAYLARYLGMLLLDGEDLTARDGRLYIRTIAGLKPIDVLLRRLDASYTDPLMFNPDSQIGTPGLGHAARIGSVVLANALGAGVVEAPGFMAFMPELARSLLGEELHLPNVETLWCGDVSARKRVLADLRQWVIGPAAGEGGAQGAGPVLMRDADQRTVKTTRQAVASRGIDFIAHEPIDPSTMPVWAEDGLSPRRFSLRVFAARTAEGWRMMPGGFCRMSGRIDARAVSLHQRSSRISDVWVAGGAFDSGATLLKESAEGSVRRRQDILPSRTAENLFWLGRYLERAEALVRLVRALASRLVEFDADEDRVIAVLAEILHDARALDPAIEGRKVTGGAMVRALADPELAGGLRAVISSALLAAFRTRDRVSPDAWRTLHDLRALVSTPPPLQASEQDAFIHCNQVLQLMSAFAGLAQHNMNRVASWRFLQIGKRIERANAIVDQAIRLADPEAPAGAFEALLELADSQISFRSLYAHAPARREVIELVILDSQNPRSLAFQTGRIEEHIQDLPAVNEDGLPSASRRIAISLAAALKVLVPSEADEPRLRAVGAMLHDLSDAIASDYFLLQAAAPEGPAPRR